MEQVAEALKVLKNHMSSTEWDQMVEKIREETRNNNELVIDWEIEAVFNAIISIYG
jgi:hypothetical protein